MHHPLQWVISSKSIGSDDEAVAYLGRYRYRSVTQEKNTAL